jgi:hypothetical protein
MTIMNGAILATTFSLAVTGTSLLCAASGQATSAPDPKVGTRITITGCLHEGTGRDSFVLLGVTERPADSPASIQPVPYAIYWLDSTEKFDDRPRPTGASRSSSSLEVKRPVYKLAVEDVRSVKVLAGGPACR